MAVVYEIAHQRGPTRGNIVFVHGLGGHPFKSFQDDPKNINTFWPFWIADEVPGTSVFSIGYQAPPTDFTGQALNLKERALTFELCLLNKFGNSNEPIVLICHSLGGLVVKRLLRLLSEKKDRSDEAAKLLKRITGVVFLATPHLGARIATWADRLSFFTNRSRAVVEMTEHNPELDDLNSWFRDWDDRQKCEIFYETLGQSFFGIVVPKNVGDPGLKQVQAYAIERDHIGVPKPPGREDILHQSVVRFLERPGILEEMPKENPSTTLVTELKTLPWQKLPVIPRVIRAAPLVVVVLLVLFFVWPALGKAIDDMRCGPAHSADSFKAAVDDDNYDLVTNAICRTQFLVDRIKGTTMPPLIYSTVNELENATAALIEGGAALNTRALVRLDRGTTLCEAGGTTALMVAAFRNNEAIARDLMTAGADPLIRDACQQSAATIASSKGSVSVLKILPWKDSGNLQLPLSPISVAWADSVSISAIRVLLSALRSDETISVDYILSEIDLSEWRGESNQTIAHLAIEEKANKSLPVILDIHPEFVDAVDASGNTPLHAALLAGNDVIAAELLRRGADVRKSNGSGVSPWDVAFSSANTALQEAILTREKITTHHLITMILAGDQLPSIQAHFDLSMPPLNEYGQGSRGRYLKDDYPTDYWHYEIEQLRQAIDQHSITPLQAAIIRGSPEIVDWLLGVGSDPNASKQSKRALIELTVLAASWPKSKREELGEPAAQILEILFEGDEIPQEWFRFSVRSFQPPVMIQAAWSLPLMQRLWTMGAQADIGYGSDLTALSAAADVPENLEAVRFLIEKGADIRQGDFNSGPNILALAIARRDAALVDTILPRLNSVDDWANLDSIIDGIAVSYQGSLISLSVCVADKDSVSKLLNRDAQIRHPLSSHGALTLAALLGDIEMASLVVREATGRIPLSNFRDAVGSSCTADVFQLLCENRPANDTGDHCDPMNAQTLPQTCNLDDRAKKFSCASLRMLP